MSTALGKTCTACGSERKKKGIMYHPETFMPYCDNPWICNDDHPNSPKNLIARGGELELIDFDKAQEGFQGWLALNHPDKEKAEKIRRMVQHPTTVRIGSPEHAQFLLDLQEEFKFASISDAVRYCIQLARERKWDFTHKLVGLQTEKRIEEQLVETTKQITEQLATKPVAVAVEPESLKAEKTPAESDDFLGSF